MIARTQLYTNYYSVSRRENYSSNTPDKPNDKACKLKQQPPRSQHQTRPISKSQRTALNSPLLKKTNITQRYTNFWGPKASCRQRPGERSQARADTDSQVSRSPRWPARPDHRLAEFDAGPRPRSLLAAPPAAAASSSQPLPGPEPSLHCTRAHTLWCTYNTRTFRGGGGRQVIALLFCINLMKKPSRANETQSSGEYSRGIY